MSTSVVLHAVFCGPSAQTGAVISALGAAGASAVQATNHSHGFPYAAGQSWVEVASHHMTDLDRYVAAVAPLGWTLRLHGEMVEHEAGVRFGGLR